MNGGFGFRRPVVSKTYGELETQSTPWSADQPAADPWIEYDVQTYTSAVTTRLTFFQQTQATPNLSNLDAGGVLPYPNYLEVHFIVLDAYAEDGSWISTEADQTGIADDIGKLLQSSLATWTLYLAGKTYGPFPAAACTGLSGGAGMGWGGAVLDLQQGINGPRDGGFFVGGAWTIPPQQSYSIVIEWQTAVTLTVDETFKLRFGLVGTKYRKVS